MDQLYRTEANLPSGPITDLDAHYRTLLAAHQERSNRIADPERLAEGARRLSTGRKFLDVGAGNGYFTRAALDAGFTCTAIEPGETSAAIFERFNGFRPLARTFDDQFSRENEGAFDVVLLSQVLEHIPNPRSAVENIRRVLTNGGICVIAVPHFGSVFSKAQGKNDMYITPPEHVNYFSRRGLVKLFEQHDFSCTELYTVSHYNREDMRRRFKVRPVADLAYGLLCRIMSAADAVGRGMMINAFFVKEDSSPS